ncbi:MAG TPA: penicillin-binding protein 2 [Chitinophagaceae bacterium]|nr:penicillin-binding protein 2 [Chitinophagaceae bacterium]
MSVFNQSRKNVIRLIFSIAFIIILIRLVHLQIFSGKYRQLAQENAILRKIIHPSRGIIFDRKGKAILDNTTMYDLMVTPSLVKGADTFSLCRILGIDTIEFKERIITAIIKNTRNRPSVFSPLLPPDKYAKISENLYKFQPGFFLQERQVRLYPYAAAANILGYLGEVDSAFLKSHAEDGYQLGDYTGMTGLERTYEKVLMGERGVQYILKDNLNRPKGPYENGAFDTAAIAGKHLYSAIDISLQELGEKLMANKVGAIVAIDPKTGGILAMVSAPTYNPNLLTGSERRNHFNELYRDPALPLLNRAVNAYYSPGSTFKTLVGLIGLHEGVISPGTTVTCSGGYYGCGRKMGCHAVGTFSLREAISHSCNAYFATVFRRTIDNNQFPTIDSAMNNWAKYMNSFGMGRRLGVDIPYEKRGLIPTANYYNDPKIFGKNGWNSCTIVSLAIGQGEVNATLIQLANAIAIIANKGFYYTPHIIDSIQGGDAFGLLDPYRQKQYAVKIPDEVYEVVHDGMQQVMESGTAAASKVPGIIVCGKTGTVENSYKGVKQKDHAFFAAFAPRENPKIAIAVMCENAGFGASSAAPIASLMIEQYLKDSIEGPERKALKERVENLNLIPPRIYKEMINQDSLGIDSELEVKENKETQNNKNRSKPSQKTKPEVLLPNNKKKTELIKDSTNN